MTAAFVPQMPLSSSVSPPDDNRKYFPEMGVAVDKLPSKSLAYPPGSTIHYRPYSFGEVKKISQMKSLTDIELFDFALDGVTTSFDKERLTMPDILYIGLLRKISTVGVTNASIHCICSKCKNRVSKQFSIQDIDFHDMKAPDLPVIVTLSNQTMEFSPLSLGAFRKLYAMKKHDDEIAIYAAQCLNLTFEEAYKLIYNANAADHTLLEEVDEYMYHSLAPVDVQCECGAKNKIEPDGEAALIAPFRVDEGATRSRIQFGKRAAH
jgi:hypothetical protein